MENNYTVTQLRPGLWAIDEGKVRSFLVEGTDRALLADTGFGSGDLAGLVTSLTDKPVTVVITHGDGDHIGGCHQFEDIRLHPAEFDRYFSSMARFTPPKNPPKPLWEGDVLDLGGRKLEVFLTPGHTPGSIVFLERQERWLLGGDQVQTDSVYMFGPGRNVPAYIHSLGKLQELSAHFDVIFSCHGVTELAPDMIGETLSAAHKLLAGELKAQPAPMNMPCQCYRSGRVGFLY